jgi:hypothetical protein
MWRLSHGLRLNELKQNAAVSRLHKINDDISLKQYLDIWYECMALRRTNQKTDMQQKRSWTKIYMRTAGSRTMDEDSAKARRSPVAIFITRSPCWEHGAALTNTGSSDNKTSVPSPNQRRRSVKNAGYKTDTPEVLRRERSLERLLDN